MIGDERQLLLEEELLIVRHSGEIPEIALHSTLHYLIDDPDGPSLVLQEEELSALQDAALARYREIILRDLDPENRDTGMYRGVARSIANFHRMEAFCRRIGRECTAGFRAEVAEALLSFLDREINDVQSNRRASSVNTARSELEKFASELHLDCSALPNGWSDLCPKTGKK